jgi:hypothetical protein
MSKYINLLIYVGCVFLLGGYTSSHFRHNEPIELCRWVVTTIFCIGNLILFLGNDKGASQ